MYPLWTTLCKYHNVESEIKYRIELNISSQVNTVQVYICFFFFFFYNSISIFMLYILKRKGKKEKEKWLLNV